MNSKTVTNIFKRQNVSFLRLNDSLILARQIETNQLISLTVQWLLHNTSFNEITETIIQRHFLTETVLQPLSKAIFVGEKNSFKGYFYRMFTTNAEQFL